MASNVASSAINSFSLRGLVTGGDAFDEDAFGRGAFGRDAMAGVAAGMAGNFVRTGLDSRISDSSLSGFAKKYAGGVRTLTGTLGNFASTGVTYAMTDNARVNLINASMFGLTNKDGDAVSVGLFEFGFGKDGVQAAIGMGGTDMNLGRIASSINGINALYQNHKINEYTASHGGIEANVALRALFSYGDDVGTDTYRDILDGRTKLAVNENLEGDATAKTVMNKDGTKTIILRSLSNDVNAGVTAGIVLQHEAYRDGEKSADQQAETRAAVKGHTEMAINVLKDGMYVNAILSNGNLVKDIGNYMKGEAAFREYADAAYDSTGDYWKLMEDGSLKYDGDGWLKDPNGNYILDKNGQRIGAQGVQSGLQNILGITSSQAYQMMVDQGLTANEGSSMPWNHDGNEDKKITLKNESYFQKYRENLIEHNTLNIYTRLVNEGQMEKDPRYEATLKGAGKEVAEKLYGSGDISYEQYKENNFIHDVGYDMVQLNRQEGRVTSPYGIRVNPITGEAGVSHAGIDIALIEGTKIQPMADGIVDFIGYSSDLGNHLVMSHEISYMYKGERKTSTFFTDYSHLQDNAQGSPNVTYGIGDYVGSNAFVAYSGNTGGSTGAHLHTGVLFQNPGYDPYAKWLEMQGNSAFPRKRGNRRGYSFDPSLFW